MSVFPYSKYLCWCAIDEEKEHEYQMQLNSIKEKIKTPDSALQYDLAHLTPALKVQDPEKIFEFWEYHLWHYDEKEEDFLRMVKHFCDNDFMGQKMQSRVYSVEWVEKKEIEGENQSRASLPIVPIELNSGNFDLDNRFRQVLYLCKYRSDNYTLQTKTVRMIRVAIDDHPHYREEFIERLKFALREHLQEKRPKSIYLRNKIDQIIYYNYLGSKNILLWLENDLPDYKKSESLPLNFEYQEAKEREKIFSNLPTDEEYTFEKWESGELNYSGRFLGGIRAGKKGVETVKIKQAKEEAFFFFLKESIFKSQADFIRNYLDGLDPDFVLESEIKDLEAFLDSNLELKKLAARNRLDDFIWDLSSKDYERYKWKNEFTIMFGGLYKNSGMKNTGFEVTYKYMYLKWLELLKDTSKSNKKDFLLDWYSTLPKEKQRILLKLHTSLESFFCKEDLLNNKIDGPERYTQESRQLLLNSSELEQVIMLDYAPDFQLIEEQLNKSKVRYLSVDGQWIGGKGELVAFLETVKKRGYTKKGKGYLQKKIDKEMKLFFERRYKVNFSSLWKPSKRKEELDKHGHKFFWIKAAED